MALVRISEAANLVRKNPGDLYRDVDHGRLQTTRTAEGDLLLDTEDLKRHYALEAETTLSPEQMKIAVLEERNRSLERALALEAELRKVKDQVANELRARLADKDNVIKVLESKVLFLEYDKQVASLPVEENVDLKEDHRGEARPGRHGKGGWLSRLLKRRAGSSLSK